MTFGKFRLVLANGLRRIRLPKSFEKSLGFSLSGYERGFQMLGLQPFSVLT